MLVHLVAERWWVTSMEGQGNYCLRSSLLTKITYRSLIYLKSLLFYSTSLLIIFFYYLHFRLIHNTYWLKCHIFIQLNHLINVASLLTVTTLTDGHCINGTPSTYWGWSSSRSGLSTAGNWAATPVWVVWCRSHWKMVQWQSVWVHFFLPIFS